MDLAELLKWVILPVLLAYIGYNEHDKVSIKNDVDKTMSKEEVEQFVDLKIEPHNVQIQDIKADLDKIDSKLDKVLDKLSAK